MSDDLFKYDGVALGDLIRRGELAAPELLEMVITRIEKINPKINAVIYKLYDQARVDAKNLISHKPVNRGNMDVFKGVPFLLKDLFAESKGTPFSEGSKAIDGYISRTDTELVKRIKNAGMIVTGKTNAAEFGLLPASETIFHGSTRNPWDSELTSGGSSGGSAAAVAAGIVPMAHGNDGGGSIRIPASCCGLFGLKPTRGRNPIGPLFGDIGGGILHEHAITRTVRDSAALLDITSGPDIGDPYCAPEKIEPFVSDVGGNVGTLKIGFVNKVPDGWDEITDIHPDCQDAVKDAALLCESLGHKIEEIDADVLGFPEVPQKFGIVFACFLGHAIAYWERELGRKIQQDELEPITWKMYQDSLNITGANYLVVVEELQRFSRKIARWYHDNQYDMLLTPTMRIPPTKLGDFELTEEDPTKWIRMALSFVVFTRTQNITGQPAMSVPLYWNGGNIPIGVQFAGRFGDEATLFRLAAQLEQARPWAKKIPPIHVSRL
ncbi:MAG: hypothetical protein BBJ57_04715 [Desulfobacterales bacterium PC51MH44]|nr:MAG: hypothetical protein BBJ57_04715 [Desulfobacterales bacterium PC51MH44]